MRLNKLFRIAFFACALLAFSSASAKNKRTLVYAYGLSASFNDSTVYFTDIQPIDAAYISDKSHFLYGRENYANQLRDYLSNKGMQHRTCIIVYKEKRSDVEKKFLAMRKRYTDKGNFNVKYIKLSDFRFQAVSPTDDDNTEAVLSK
ncbi:hypothetical protein [Hoylesella enoeca]|uniref:Uncharacterized protein n=1 Tax=Hoylesella enoeca TaxID=76123 RepID=A0A0S2KIW5_9BACT|nr:hypothetical protein [Hoylesella enoeca]ALO48046.1 hypothetical protein AS203_02175 [Hoylesella enoeca]